MLTINKLRASAKPLPLREVYLPPREVPLPRRVFSSPLPLMTGAMNVGSLEPKEVRDARRALAPILEGQRGEPDVETGSPLPPLPAPLDGGAGYALGYGVAGGNPSPLPGGPGIETGGGVKPLDAALPAVVDAESLANAVAASPQSVFTALTNIVWGRDDAVTALAGMASTCDDLQLARAEVESLRGQLDRVDLELSETKSELREANMLLRQADKEAKEATDKYEGIRTDMAAQKQNYDYIDWSMKQKNKMLFKIINYYEYHHKALGLRKVYSVFNAYVQQNDMIRSSDPQGVESKNEPLPLFPEGTNNHTEDFNAAVSGMPISTSTAVPSSSIAPSSYKGKEKEREMPPAPQGPMIPPPVPTYAQAATGNKNKKGKKGKNSASAASSVTGALSSQDQTEWLAGSVSSLAITRPGSAFSASFNPGAESFVPNSSPPKFPPVTIPSSSRPIPFAYASKTVPPVHGEVSPQILQSLIPADMATDQDLLPTERPNLCFTMPPPMPHPGQPYSGAVLTGQSIHEASKIDDATIRFLVENLPEHVRDICPISISCNSLCTVPGCKLRKLCDEFNDESLPLSANGHCSRPNCTLVHMFRTCEQEFNGAQLGCQVWMDAQKARNHNTYQPLGLGGHSHAHPLMSHTQAARIPAGSEAEKRERHALKRAHQTTCTAEENTARTLLFQLIDIHRVGRYLG